MADFCFKKPAFNAADQEVPTEPAAKRRRQEMPEAGKNKIIHVFPEGCNWKSGLRAQIMLFYC